MSDRVLQKSIERMSEALDLLIIKSAEHFGEDEYTDQINAVTIGRTKEALDFFVQFVMEKPNDVNACVMAVREVMHKEILGKPKEEGIDPVNVLSYGVMRDLEGIILDEIEAARSGKEE